MRLIDADELVEWLEEVTVTDSITFKTGFAQILTDIKQFPTYTPPQKNHCDECMHLINRRYGRGGALFGKCELKTWRETRYGRNVACKKFKQQDECADFI